MASEKCIFCEIVKGRNEAYIFYEDKDIIGFMDLYPVDNGHSLIMPSKHYENIFDIDLSTYLRIHGLARILAMAMKDSLGADGINIGQNNGESANQKVNHYHLHVIPRWRNNDLNWARIEMSAAELKRNSDRLKSSLNALFDRGFKLSEC